MNALNRLNGLVVKGCCKSNFWRTSHAIWSFSFVWLVPFFIFVAGAFTIFERPPTRFANFLGGGPPKGTSSTPPRDTIFETPPTRFAHFYKWKKGTRVIPGNPKYPPVREGSEGGVPYNQSIPGLNRGPLTLHFVPSASSGHGGGY